MPSKAFLRGNELRQKIKHARDNESIILPLKENDFGEYQGPLVLDRPVTISGKGNKTPLMGKGCPALIILSPGIRLENIELSDSFDSGNGVALIVCDGAQPILDNVKIIGKKMNMSTDQLIDLGDFLPQQQASSYFEIEVTGPARIKCAENSAKWLRVFPEMLPGAGKYLLQFTCEGKALGPDAFAVGSIEVTSASSVKTLWVTVHVLAAAPVNLLTAPIDLVLGKDNRIYFSEGFIIGKDRFPGVASASTLAERQAIILKDTVSGIWTIYQPWTTPTPTSINGKVLAQGQRLCLQDGCQIKAGNLEFRVELLKVASNYSVDKTTLDLGNTGGTVVDRGFKLKYSGNAKDKPKINVIVPWLQVNPATAEFQKGDIKEILVSTTPAVAALPKNKHLERSAILIQTKNETLSLDVRLDVMAETIILRVVPDNLKFGVISDWAKNQVSLTIYNDGTREWKPSAQIDCDWLEIEPASISVPPGKSAVLTARPNQKAEKLPSPSDQQAVLTLTGNGSTLKIGVSAKIQLLTADPVLDTPVIDFNELDDVSQSNPATLIIRNKGKKDWNSSKMSAIKRI